MALFFAHFYGYVRVYYYYEGIKIMIKYFN